MHHTPPLPHAHEELVAYCEQVVYRRSLCGECVEAGNCIRCGCPVNGLMLNPEETDKDGLWHQMVKHNEWVSFKENLGLEFNISFNQKS